LAMIWKGMKELEHLGILTGSLPRMYGVQGETFGAIATSSPSKKVREEEGMEGLASDIKVEHPLLGAPANKAMKESGGGLVAVSDNEILDAAAQLARTEGIFAEPAGAATIAGLRHLADEGLIRKSDRVVCLITGGGLKDPTSVRRFLTTSVQARKILKQVESSREISAIGRTKLRILRLLDNHELHGYALWKNLLSEYSLVMKLPSVYQH